MNILNNKTLKEGLDNIFKSDSKILKDRKQLAELIIKNDAEFYKNIEDEKTETFNQIHQAVKSKNISNVEAINRFKIMSEDFLNKKEKLINTQNIPLIEKFKEIYSSPLVKNGFTNQVNLESIYSFNRDQVSYQKEYDESIFVISFDISHYEGNEGIILNISVENKNQEMIMMTIDLISETEKIQLRIIELTHRDLLITNVSEKIKVDFLASITEDNILDLDNPEIEDLNLILHDFNFKLSEEPIYQSFKKGFSEFKAIIEKSFSQKKNLKLNI